MQQPTLRDVAKAAGVHAATASRALNPATRGLVNAETARRVINIAESLGYRANPIARGLKTSKSQTVGIVIPDLTNPLFPPIVRGIEHVLEPAGYSVLIVSTDNDPGRERAQIESLRSRQVDGLIVATALLAHPLLEELADEELNLVLVNRRAENLGISSVTPDDAAGVRIAVEHLAGLGHHRIVHLAGPQTTSTGVLRASAFRSTVSELGLDSDPELVVTCAYWTEADGAEALRRLLDAGTEFTGIVAGNDLIALGCYDVFAEVGLQLPDRCQRGRVQRHALPRQAAAPAHHHCRAAVPDRGGGGTDAPGRHRGAGPPGSVRAPSRLLDRPRLHGATSPEAVASGREPRRGALRLSHPVTPLDTRHRESDDRNRLWSPGRRAA